jgi:hypothetical protein
MGNTILIKLNNERITKHKYGKSILIMKSYTSTTNFQLTIL